VNAQSAADDDATPAELQQLTLDPTLGFALGWDDNVFRLSEAVQPPGDLVATVTAGLAGAFRLNRTTANGRSQVLFNYFRRFDEIESVDTVNDGRVDWRLGRLVPYVGGDYANGRHRRDLEIDLPIRRVDWSWVAGLDWRLSSRTSIGVYQRRLYSDFSGETIYEGTDLAEYLEEAVLVTGVSFRYALTPFTTIGFDVDRDRTEFPDVPERNAEGSRLMSVIEFKPLALVSGRAYVGVRRRHFVDGQEPPFQGLVARVDLGYSPWVRTRVTVSLQRDLAYSYRADQRDYLPSGFEITVVQRLSQAWDVQGGLSRFALNYGLGELATDQGERVAGYRFDVGYRLRRTRVGFNLERQTRSSDFALRRYYEGTRLGSSVTYEF
jgi:hypothetical protein